ncbi:hypothetical protein A3F55_02080 [Candidatus Adlerbacteria bacterium RIFCSPHIGHO2_12_FULL_53_18]|uniref:DNA polymerase III delta N-terminal domain-containing protein n=1 Tax=Candidatus Adlerbacteria bacterium RIFCSPHIGHO2_12_FULL_53_18 TaxID=1797242 RepID=A0A1F4XS61_9BACT|nr:MAG: hypothetical protein A3F55_02080 [Candidatus Adlerbacteria bacterium RIFCSPHIGHO2_12_FULL_53_18]
MHHAYYIEGPLSLFEPYVAQMKPLWAEKFDRFGVDDARALIERSQLKNFGEATFLIAVGSITTEAQQALLKLFEEPQMGTTFVLIVPHGTIIPTLRSRMLPYPRQDDILPLQDAARFNLATQFLKSSQKERSDYVVKLLKDDEGAREAVRALLNELERELHVRLRKSHIREMREGLEDIAKVRSYVGDRSPSLKMLMEHLALSIPILK